MSANAGQMGQLGILQLVFKRGGMPSRNPAKPVPRNGKEEERGMPSRNPAKPVLRNGKEERGRGEVIYFSSFEPTSTKYFDTPLSPLF